MKFVCLGYIEEGKWEQYSEEEQKSLMETCFAYDDELRREDGPSGEFGGTRVCDLGAADNKRTSQCCKL